MRTMINSKNKMMRLGMIFGIMLAMFLFQACDVQKATVETKEEAKFNNSGHADASSVAFTDWDDAVPKVVPKACARCHTVAGYTEFTTTGTVVNDVPPAGAFTCNLCHTNPGTGETRTLANGVYFPSGVVIKDAGKEALCMQCHSGRTSVADVDAAITKSGAAIDTPTSKLSFTNIHYLAAAATMYGTVTKGGYQYTGKEYDAKFQHIEGYGACTDCHDPHSLEVKVENCKTCHTYVKSESNLKDIRWVGSLVDYDGNGNISEGIYYEIEGVKAKLLNTIKAYATEISKKDIAYSAASYPYFFNDLNGNGVVDTAEATSANKYASFTPRLLKACYNYQVSVKDPGAFAHGGKYIIELIYDSMEDLNSAIASKVSMVGMSRTDEGHFDGSAMAWRDWDGEAGVPSGCARCHSSNGLAEFLETGKNASLGKITNGMLCTTCHTSPPSLRAPAAGSIMFPYGVSVSMGNDGSNLCISCHQARASKKTIDNAIAAKPGDYSFSNPHYYGAGALFFGSQTHGGYEYPGKVYAGMSAFPNHMGDFNTCVQCHMGIKGVKTHNVADPPKENCVPCHGQDIAQQFPGSDPGKFSFYGIRPGTTPDYDADGNMTESLQSEIQGLIDAEYAQLQAYANSLGKPLAYSNSAYPYFFKDTNANGVVDPSEALSANAYKFDAKSLKAAYNYQFIVKDPHAFIHNAPYAAQLLVDSIQDLGGDVSKYTWR